MSFYGAFIKAIQILIKGGFKKKIALFVFFTLIVALFEYLSIGIFIPFLNFILNSSELDFFLKEYRLLDIIDKNLFFLICIVLIIIIFFLRFLFSLYFIHFRNKIIYQINLKFSDILFKKYLNQNYSFHLKKNSSELIIMMNEVASFGSSTLLYLSNLFTDLVITTAIIILLVQFEPIGSFLIFLLIAFFSITFYIFYKKKIKNIGKNRVISGEKRLRYMKESFSSIKEIFIYDVRDLFINKLYKINDIFFDLSTKERKIELFPRIYLEYLILVFFVILSLILKMNGSSNNEIVFIVGVFAMAGFKLMPSANRILTSLQGLRAKIYSISKISEELDFDNISNFDNQFFKFKNYDKKDIDTKLVFENKITLEKIDFKYDEARSFVFKNLSLDIPKNKIIGIVGKSGAGKSTFIDLLTGLLKPISGCVKIDNKPLDKENLINWLEQISYVPQKAYLLDDTLRNNIVFGDITLNIDDQDRYLDEIIKKLCLTDLINQLPEKINTKIGEDGVQLSGGQRQRIILARALYKKSNIIILDETTNALDIETENEILNDIFKLKNKTIIIISHRPETLKDVDILYKIESQGVKKQNKN